MLPQAQAASRTVEAHQRGGAARGAILAHPVGRGRSHAVEQDPGSESVATIGSTTTVFVYRGRSIEGFDRHVPHSVNR